VEKPDFPCCSHYFLPSNDLIGHSKPNAVILNLTLLGLPVVLVSIILKTNHIKTEMLRTFSKYTHVSVPFTQ
jgi:hypothetical protein